MEYGGFGRILISVYLYFFNRGVVLSVRIGRSVPEGRISLVKIEGYPKKYGDGKISVPE